METAIWDADIAVVLTVLRFVLNFKLKFIILFFPLSFTLLFSFDLIHHSNLFRLNQAHF